MYLAGVNAARPGNAVQRGLRREGTLLLFSASGDETTRGSVDLGTGARRIVVIGAGKASLDMCSAAVDILQKCSESVRISGALVTKAGTLDEAHHATTAETLKMYGIKTIESSHPVPDESSIKAGEALLDAAASAKGADLALVLISGGASSLAFAPVEGTSL